MIKHVPLSTRKTGSLTVIANSKENWVSIFVHILLKSGFEIQRKVKLAVDRLWVARSHRRRGIGTELLSAVAKSQGVTRRQICLTDPTDDGAALGGRFFERLLVAHI